MERPSPTGTERLSDMPSLPCCCGSMRVSSDALSQGVSTTGAATLAQAMPDDRSAGAPGTSWSGRNVNDCVRGSRPTFASQPAGALPVNLDGSILLADADVGGGTEKSNGQPNRSDNSGTGRSLSNGCSAGSAATTVALKPASVTATPCRA